VTISVPLIAAATPRVEASGFSFWDGLIIESAIGCCAHRLWTEDLQDGQTFGIAAISPTQRPRRRTDPPPSVPSMGRSSRTRCLSMPCSCWLIWCWSSHH